jgi:hypothetical protein
VIYLTVPPNAERSWTYADELLGVMMTPNMGNVATLGHVAFWAADNGCFTKGEAFDLLDYYLWLNERRPASLSCLFATGPDVVGDAPATWCRSAETFDAIRTLGYRPALVGQDGLEDHSVSWDEHEAWDWLFLGGSTTWKLSEAARECTTRARSLGKSVHMGRVNSLKRLRIAEEWGVTSADGTYVAFAPDKNLPRLVEWLHRLDDELTLFDNREEIPA